MDFTIQLGASRMGAELIWSGSSNSHLYASGQSGSGKSCFLKHCAAQLPGQGVRCIVFDYTGTCIRLACPVTVWMSGRRCGLSRSGRCFLERDVWSIRMILRHG